VLLKVIAVVTLAIAVAVAVFVFTMSRQTEPGAPSVKFTEFTPDKVDIKVGESTNVVFNVQNLEEKSVNNSKVMIVIEPSSYQPYLSINDPTIELQELRGKDARTGQIQVTIFATSAPAKEAVYTVKGVLLVDGKQADIREFDLKIHQ